MLRLAAEVLLFDTAGFLFITLAMTHTAARFEQPLLRFIDKHRLLVLALFPWLLFLICLEKPGRHLRRSVWRYEMCYLLFTIGAMALMLVGASLWNDGIVDCGMVVFIWILLLDILIRDGKNNGGNHIHHDEPPADSPTPTADAVERWLQSQRPLV
jgi:hypothetical protein